MQLIIRLLSLAGLLLIALGLYLTISGAANQTDALSTGKLILGLVVLGAASLLLLAGGVIATASAVKRGTKPWWIGIVATLLGGVVAPGAFNQLTQGSPLPTASTGGGLPGYLPYLVGLLLPSLSTLAYSFTGGGDQSNNSGSHRPALAGLSIVTLGFLGLTTIATVFGRNILSSVGGDATFVLTLAGVALALVVAGTLALLALRHRRFKWFSGLVPVTILSVLLLLIFTPLGAALNIPFISQIANGTTAVILAILVPIATLISSLFSHNWPQSASS